MAIKKGIEPGMILAKREIYGVMGNFLNYNYIGTGYRFLEPVRPSDIPEDSIIRHDMMYHTYTLKLNSRRARSNGAVIPEDMVPLMNSLNIKVLPYRKINNRRHFDYIQYFPGTYEESEVKEITINQVRNVSVARISLEATVKEVLPSYPKYEKYYIAVGTSVGFNSTYDGFIDVDVDDALTKYTSEIKNNDYFALLDKGIQNKQLNVF